MVWGNANGAGEDNRNVGRMAVLLAGLPVRVPATTVNRLCGSSLDAAMTASRLIETGDADVAVAGGVESMTRAPWVLPKPARGFPAGDVTAVSTTLGWRLVNERMPAEWTVSLGEANEQLAEALGIPRSPSGRLRGDVPRARGPCLGGGFLRRPRRPRARRLAVARRVHPRRHHPRGPRRAAPAFRADGSITAGNASPLNDGAAALLLGSEEAADSIGVDADRPDRRPRRPSPSSPTGSASPPSRRPSGRWPGLGSAGRDVGAVELNEAFAVQALACVDAWGIDPEHRQHQGRGHRHRAPSRRVGGAPPRHPRAPAAGVRRAVGGRGDLHRRRAGPRGRARERVRGGAA